MVRSTPMCVVSLFRSAYLAEHLPRLERRYDKEMTLRVLRETKAVFLCADFGEDDLVEYPPPSPWIIVVKAPHGGTLALARLEVILLKEGNRTRSYVSM
jgi:hypothetical protein